jgi:hypothetical protein
MLTTKKCLLLLVMGVFLLSGCPAVIVGGAAAGAGSGTYFYINGELKTDYYYSFDKVWAACEKAVADMHGLDVEPNKEIARGTITTLIDDEKVKFAVEYKAKNVTTVSIRVGLIGNRLSSQLLHDKVADNIKK